jgi:hypothetical protein
MVLDLMWIGSGGEEVTRQPGGPAAHSIIRTGGRRVHLSERQEEEEDLMCRDVQNQEETESSVLIPLPAGFSFDRRVGGVVFLPLKGPPGSQRAARR